MINAIRPTSATAFLIYCASASSSAPAVMPTATTPTVCATTLSSNWRSDARPSMRTTHWRLAPPFPAWKTGCRARTSIVWHAPLSSPSSPAMPHHPRSYLAGQGSTHDHHFETVQAGGAGHSVQGSYQIAPAEFLPGQGASAPGDRVALSGTTANGDALRSPTTTITMIRSTRRRRHAPNLKIRPARPEKNDL